MGELEDKISGILGDPAQMDKITKMASSLFGGAKEDTPAPTDSGLGDLLGGIDPEMLSKLGKIMSKQDGGGKTALLKAMSPYLAQKRRDKMEKAVRFAQIAKIAGIAFGEHGGGEDV